MNICTLDLSKAFDQMNHNGLLINLIRLRLTRLPVDLFNVSENLFSACYTSVKWFAFKLKCGVRQVGVLLPYLFATFSDDIAVNIAKTSAGCYMRLYYIIRR